MQTSRTRRRSNAITTAGITMDAETVVAVIPKPPFGGETGGGFAGGDPGGAGGHGGLGGKDGGGGDTGGEAGEGGEGGGGGGEGGEGGGGIGRRTRARDGASLGRRLVGRGRGAVALPRRARRQLVCHRLRLHRSPRGGGQRVQLAAHRRARLGVRRPLWLPCRHRIHRHGQLPRRPLDRHGGRRQRPPVRPPCGLRLRLRRLPARLWPARLWRSQPLVRQPLPERGGGGGRRGAVGEGELCEGADVEEGSVGGVEGEVGRLERRVTGLAVPL
mmetsp:Transcript_7891/g.22614  ORF Transcript_7891/g.22614 Transcript_7891/m.22614 type:complete len:273 (-) Transcript_7891:57-875(-)